MFEHRVFFIVSVSYSINRLMSLSSDLYMYFQLNNYNSWFEHHHHVLRLAWIFLTLSLHVTLSFIASGRSSGLHPVSSHSCSMYVRAGRPAFQWPYAGVHRSTSLTSSSLLIHHSTKNLTFLFILQKINIALPFVWPIIFSATPRMYIYMHLRDWILYFDLKSFLDNFWFLW